MNAFLWLRLQTKKALLNLYGPPTLDEEHDPIVAAEREYAHDVQAVEEADAQEAREAEHTQDTEHSAGVEGSTDPEARSDPEA
ncbi:MAG: hypothetical protein WCF36_21910 [Candidatus Nanopelagicales bacterium]